MLLQIKRKRAENTKRPLRNDLQVSHNHWKKTGSKARDICRRNMRGESKSRKSPRFILKRFWDREEEERFPFRKGIIVIMWAQHKLQGGGKESRETQKSCETGASERQENSGDAKIAKTAPDLRQQRMGRKGKNRRGLIVTLSLGEIGKISFQKNADRKVTKGGGSRWKHSGEKEARAFLKKKFAYGDWREKGQKSL